MDKEESCYLIVPLRVRTSTKGLSWSLSQSLSSSIVPTSLFLQILPSPNSQHPAQRTLDPQKSDAYPSTTSTMPFTKSSFSKRDFKSLIHDLKTERASYLWGRDLTDPQECEKVLELLNKEIYYKLQIGQKPQGQYKRCIAKGKHRMQRMGIYARGEPEEKYARLERWMVSAPRYRVAYGPVR